MRRTGETAVAALGITLAIVFLVVALYSCGFPAALHRTHEGVKAMSQQVEPRLAAECLRRAKKCKARGVESGAQCPELVTCRKWKARYALGVSQVHKGLLHCQGVHDDLRAAGVIE